MHADPGDCKDFYESTSAWASSEPSSPEISARARSCELEEMGQTSSNVSQVSHVLSLLRNTLQDYQLSRGGVGKTPPVISSLQVWYDKVSRSHKNSERWLNEEQLAHLFKIIANHMLSPAKDLSDWLIIFLLPKVFTHQDIQRYLNQPEFAEIKDQFNARYHPNSSFACSESAPDRLPHQYVGKLRLFADLHQEADRNIVQNLPTQSLLKMKRVSRAGYRLALQELFERRGKEACKYQQRLMQGWLSQQGHMPLTEEQRQLNYRGAIADPAGSRVHKLLCLSMMRSHCTEQTVLAVSEEARNYFFCTYNLSDPFNKDLEENFLTRRNDEYFYNVMNEHLRLLSLTLSSEQINDLISKLKPKDDKNSGLNLREILSFGALASGLSAIPDELFQEFMYLLKSIDRRQRQAKFMMLGRALGMMDSKLSPMQLASIITMIMSLPYFETSDLFSENLEFLSEFITNLPIIPDELIKKLLNRIAYWSIPPSLNQMLGLLAPKLFQLGDRDLEAFVMHLKDVVVKDSEHNSDYLDDYYVFQAAIEIVRNDTSTRDGERGKFIPLVCRLLKKLFLISELLSQGQTSLKDEFEELDNILMSISEITPNVEVFVNLPSKLSNLSDTQLKPLVRHLQFCLKHSNWGLKRAAVVLLSELSSNMSIESDVINELFNGLMNKLESRGMDDSDRQLLVVLLPHLFETHLVDLIELFMSKLDDEHFFILRHAAEVLGLLASRLSAAHLDTVSNAIKKGFYSDDIGIRHDAIIAIGQLAVQLSDVPGLLVDELMEMLNDHEYSIREAAMQTLCALTQKLTSTQLTACFQKSDNNSESEQYLFTRYIFRTLAIFSQPDPSASPVLMSNRL